MDLTYAFMFPISVFVAITAMTFGVGGAVFFSPIFILLFPAVGVPTLTPSLAFSTALLTELVGFTSGLIGYGYMRLIDWKQGTIIILICTPFSVGGAFIKSYIPPGWLIISFAVGIVGLAGYVAYSSMVESAGMGNTDEAENAALPFRGVTARTVSIPVMGGGHNPLRSNSETMPLMSSMPPYMNTMDRTINDLRHGEGNLGGNAYFTSPDMRTSQELVSTTKPDDTSSVTSNNSSNNSSKNNLLGENVLDMPDDVVVRATATSVSDELSFVLGCGLSSGEHQITARSGDTFVYERVMTAPATGLMMIGGFLIGMISIGIGETCVSNLRATYRWPVPVASATSVYVVMVVVLAASATEIAMVGVSAVPWSLVCFTMPAVFLGGQIGARLSSFLSPKVAERSLIVMSLVLGGLMADVGYKKLTEPPPPTS